MAFAVVAPLIIAKDNSGSQVYLYKGQPVPEHIGEDEIDRLVEGGFIKEIGVESDEAPEDPADEKPAKK